MLNPKVFDRAFNMVQTMVNKHEGDLRSVDFDWKVLELYDARYPDSLIQQPVPWLRMDFK
jgi:hypothetical protein